MSFLFYILLIALYPKLSIITSMFLQLVLDNLAGIITGLLTSGIVTIFLINHIYKKNYQIEVENSLNAIYYEIIYNINQLSRIESESLRIMKYWAVLKDYHLSISSWEEFKSDFNMPYSEIDPRDFVGKSWLSPKGVSSRQTFKNSKYLYQYLSDNSFQAFIAQGHHLNIKGCNRKGDNNEWEILSLLYYEFNKFNEITQKIEDDTAIFLDHIRGWILNHNFPYSIQSKNLKSLSFITHEGYRRIPFQLNITSYTGCGEIPKNDPNLSIDGISPYIEKNEYVTVIYLSNRQIGSKILNEKEMILPYYISPVNQAITFEEYIEYCHNHLMDNANILKSEINKYIYILFQSQNINELPSFEKWKRKMLI